MTYVLENQTEAERLERQSQSEQYDPERDLAGFHIDPGNRILDAGCGSGIVARILAGRYRDTQVFGMDQSENRIQDARRLGQAIPNLNFKVGSLTEPLDAHYDRILCRYVLEHMSPAAAEKSIHHLSQALSPRGKLRLIDVDGYLYNIHPTTQFLDECLQRIKGIESLDLFVGRKMPAMLEKAGLKNISWKIETLQFNTPENIQEECKLIRERFENSLSSLVPVLGSEQKVRRFHSEYLGLLEKPGTCLFYNKFIVTAERGTSHLGVIK